MLEAWIFVYSIISLEKINHSHFRTTFSFARHAHSSNVMYMFDGCSDISSGVNRERQDRYKWPLRHSASGQGEEAHKDSASGSQSRMEREILLVSVGPWHCINQLLSSYLSHQNIDTWRKKSRNRTSKKMMLMTCITL